MDELQRAPRMTVDEILEHIRALPVRERLWLVERIIQELIEDMPPDEAVGAPPAADPGHEGGGEPPAGC